LPFALGPIAVLFLHFLYYTDTPKDWRQSIYGLYCLPTLAIMFMQTLSLLSEFQLQLPETTEATWNISKYLLDILSIFRPQCAGFTSFEGNYIIDISLPLVIALVFAAVYFASLMLQIFIKSRWVILDSDVLLRCAGMCFFNFVIAVNANGLTLFKCKVHPNGRFTMVDAPFVLCWDSQQWRNVLGPGIFALLLFCVGGTALCCWVLWTLPQRAQNIGYVRKWAFLVCQFRPSVWWWGIPILIKAMALNLCTILSKSGLSQLFIYFASSSSTCWALFVSGLGTTYL